MKDFPEYLQQRLTGVHNGSSVTEGGHASLVTNAYTALLSRWLDFEYYNFRLSGSCLG